MNKGISLSKLMDEAVYLQNDKTKNLSGSIRNSAEFDDNRRALQSLHRGLFAFVAFHPQVDQQVADYIEKGSIGSDSGPNILVLFFSAKEIRFPRAITPRDLNIGVDLDMTVQPAYEFAQWLLPAESLPKFPGLIFMDRVVDSIQAVYVPIQKHATADEVADFCRSVFALANHVMKKNAEDPLSIESLILKLKSDGFEYTRSGEASVGEWLISAYQFAQRHRATIVTLISKVLKVV